MKFFNFDVYGAIARVCVDVDGLQGRSVDLY